MKRGWKEQNRIEEPKFTQKEKKGNLDREGAAELVWLKKTAKRRQLKKRPETESSKS